jgi:hypothetical protein
MKTKNEQPTVIASLPKDKICSCGHHNVKGVLVKEKLGVNGERFEGQFWFDCLSGCGSTLMLIVK